MSLKTCSMVLMPDDLLSEANNRENRGKVWNFLLAAYSFNGDHTAFDAVSSQTGGLARSSIGTVAESWRQHTVYSTDHETWLVALLFSKSNQNRVPYTLSLFALVSHYCLFSSVKKLCKIKTKSAEIS